MRQSESFERLGDIAHAYIVVVDGVGARSSGHVLGDFTLALFDPAGSDITGATAITVAEYGTTGAYRFNVPLSAAGADGAYTFTVTDPYGEVTSVTFSAYVTLQGDTGDSSAQLELWIHDAAGSPVAGVVVGDLTLRIYDPDMVAVSAGTTVPTLTELEAGHYYLGFDSSSALGAWFVDVIHPVHVPEGAIAEWRYLAAGSGGEGSSAPTMSAAANDATGTSATLTYATVNPADVVYTYYRTSTAGAWILSGNTRTGSGAVTITGLTNHTSYQFIGVASRSGSATLNQSAPCAPRSVFVSDGATIFDEIEDAIWDVVDALTPAEVTTIWSRGNAPMPEAPYVTLLMRPCTPIGEDAHGAPGVNGIRQILADRQFMLEIEVYGTTHTSGQDTAHTYLERIKMAFGTVEVADTLAEVDVSYRGHVATTDLSDIGRIDYEARYMAELEFGLTLEFTEDAGFISTSEAPTGAYG